MNEVTISPRSRELPTRETKIDDLITMFLNSNDVKQSSRDTYTRSIKPFFAWITRNRLDLPIIDRCDLLTYKDDLLKAGISAATGNSYLTAVRKFYEYVESVKLYPNIARGIKGAKSLKKFRKQPLDEVQGKSLVSHMKDHCSVRDNAIINLLLRTGLRTIEVIRANVDDITYKSGKRVLMVHGKGRDEKDAFVIITDKCYESITNYLAARKRIKPGAPLFTCTSNNNRGGRLTTRSISKIAKCNLVSIGLNSKEFSAHSLRHATAAI